jgi:Na+-translocating ferredoxin:NAD+ oxidoreductase subunit B
VDMLTSSQRLEPIRVTNVADSDGDTQGLDAVDLGPGDAVTGEFGGLTTRAGRISVRARNPKWKNPALRIDMSICINCDTCLRHCPPHFGAIFNHGLDVIIVPELCSGCGKCLPPVCPVDCIVVDPTPDPTPDDWWEYPLSSEDPYR